MVLLGWLVLAQGSQVVLLGWLVLAHGSQVVLLGLNFVEIHGPAGMAGHPKNKNKNFLTP